MMIYTYVTVSSLNELQERVKVGSSEVVVRSQPGEHRHSGVLASEVLFADVLKI